MDIRKQKDFLTTITYWAVIAAAVYFGCAYLLPMTIPLIIGILIATFIVWITKKIHCTHRLLRIAFALVIYGVIGTLIGLLAAKGVSALSGVIQLLPSAYNETILPFANLCYEWFLGWVEMLDPSLVSTLETLLTNLISTLSGLVSKLSAFAVNLVSRIATGVPSLILSIVAMIFTTVFLVSDYDRIAGFISVHIPQSVNKILKDIKSYLTDTLFVVIRSYALIMLLTFTELSILFSIFGIKNALLKAALIAVMDILPILGVGAVLVPWAIISFALGSTAMGIELLAIYIIVLVVRNLVEPKIVGAQLGLHPIITLVAMFVGLRLFGFWGLFGLPVGISFLWKRYQERKQPAATEA